MKNRATVLVVDDQQSILMLLKRMLEPEGYDVIQANDGISALNLLEERTPDIIVLDIAMPCLSGFETLKRIRQRSDIPVLMLSGICEADVVRDALVSGADDYVRKPFSKLELLARIKAKLRRCNPDAASVLAR